jgi:hypothetical protein
MASAPLPPASDRDRSALNRLMAATNAMRDPDRLLETVRSVYRANGRPRHREPFAMAAIRSYVRFFDSKPLGMLDERHVSAFVTHLADRSRTTAGTQTMVMDALRFFHAEILHRPIGKAVAYVRAESPSRRRTGEDARPARSLWSFPF